MLRLFATPIDSTFVSEGRWSSTSLLRDSGGGGGGGHTHMRVCKLSTVKIVHMRQVLIKHNVDTSA